MKPLTLSFDELSVVWGAVLLGEAVPSIARGLSAEDLRSPFDELSRHLSDLSVLRGMCLTLKTALKSKSADARMAGHLTSAQGRTLDALLADLHDHLVDGTCSAAPASVDVYRQRAVEMCDALRTRIAAALGEARA